jgi:RNA polymerase sigma factor (sigma-70 family)
MSTPSTVGRLPMLKRIGHKSHPSRIWPAMASSASDADLLASGSAGDFRLFYERHVQTVVSYVARRTRQPQLVLDVTAETFARALEHRDQYDATRGPAIAWVLGIALNEIRGALRRGRVAEEHRRRLGMASIELDDGGMAVMAHHMSMDLKDAVAALPPEQREAVARRFLLDESYADIAERVGCSEQVVRKRASRGLTALRHALREEP